jgi:hypothetical protein
MELDESDDGDTDMTSIDGMKISAWANYNSRASQGTTSAANNVPSDDQLPSHNATIETGNGWSSNQSSDRTSESVTECDKTHSMDASLNSEATKKNAVDLENQSLAEDRSNSSIGMNSNFVMFYETKRENSRFHVPTDREQNDRACEIPLFSTARPHMRAFHVSCGSKF